MTASWSVRTVRRLHRLAARLRVREVRPGRELFEAARACGAEVVSVDLFDTLVYRRCCAPEDVFLLTHSRCALLARQLPARAWVALRAAVERQLARAAAPREIHLADIHAALAASMGLSDDQAREVLACELRAERELIVPHAGVVDSLRLCHAAGMRIVVTTDTSLPAAFVQDLLADVLPLEHALLCSSATGRTKRSGEAFLHLAAQHGRHARVVHFGDNLHADVLMAVHARITAFRVRHARADFLERNRLFAQRLRALGICRIDTPHDAPGPAGEAAPAPCRRELAWRWSVVLADLVLDLARQAREVDADEIWFLSRDCEALFAALQASGQARAFGRARIRYVHSSRAASYPIAALERPQAFERWTGRAPTDADRREGERLAQAYASLADPGARRILTVDTGWRGRVQVCLQLALPGRRVFGYYLALGPGAEPGLDELVRSYLPWDRSVLNQAAAETLAGFSQPSCTGYRQAEDGSWCATFRAPDGDGAPQAYREALLAYLTGHLRQLAPGAYAAPLAWRREALRSLCAYPDRTVAQAFEGWGLDAAVGSGAGAPLIDGGSAGLGARLLGREVAGNLWPELAFWGITRYAWAVALLQRALNARKRMQHALVSARERRAGHPAPVAATLEPHRPGQSCDAQERAQT